MAGTYTGRGGMDGSTDVAPVTPPAERSGPCVLYSDRSVR